MISWYLCWLFPTTQSSKRNRRSFPFHHWSQRQKLTYITISPKNRFFSLLFFIFPKDHFPSRWQTLVEPLVSSLASPSSLFGTSESTILESFKLSTKSHVIRTFVVFELFVHLHILMMKFTIKIKRGIS